MRTVVRGFVVCELKSFQLLLVDEEKRSANLTHAEKEKISTASTGGQLESALREICIEKQGITATGRPCLSATVRVSSESHRFVCRAFFVALG